MDASLVYKLSSYINSLRPIIYINHFDHRFADILIESVADRAKCVTFTNSGIFSGKERMSVADDSLVRFIEDKLSFLEEAEKTSPRHLFIIIKDAHQYFDAQSPLYSPKCIALLKEIAERTMFAEGVYATVFFISPILILPKEIEKMITVFDLPFPDSKEVEQIITDYINSFNIPIEENIRNELVVSFKGLTEFEIRQILNYAYQQSGTFDSAGVQLVLKEKEQIIKKSGILEIFTSTAEMNDIGGLENLKLYLSNKAKIFSRLGEARKFGVDIPKGILIVGMPGCGKSLTAKATANIFNVPLLRLDIGKLIGKYVGESEHNLSAAIKTAEAVAPCVLWIDELEKAFAGVGGSSGGSDITTRLFGQFLTWLQEKESSVYVVATANNISSLPPEFLRKGRFDELFLVNLPNEEERRCIFQIHLKKRGKLTPNIDVLKLLKGTEGFNGADIENVVKEAIENAFCSSDENRTITTDKLVDVISHTKSISVTLGDKIEELSKQYEKFNFKEANGKISDSETPTIKVKPQIERSTKSLYEQTFDNTGKEAI
jgi:ATPase